MLDLGTREFTPQLFFFDQRLYSYLSAYPLEVLWTYMRYTVEYNLYKVSKEIKRPFVRRLKGPSIFLALLNRACVTPNKSLKSFMLFAAGRAHQCSFYMATTHSGLWSWEFSKSLANAQSGHYCIVFFYSAKCADFYGE